MAKTIKEKRGEAFGLKMEDFGYETDAVRPVAREEGAEAEQEEAEKEA